MNHYRSGYESQIGQDLVLRNIDFEFEKQTFDYVSGVRGGVCMECGSKKTGKNRKYTPDFIIPRDGPFKDLIVEAKGRFPSTDRSKMRDVRKANPDLDIRMLFQKRSKAQMLIISTWCEKFGFKYAFGSFVPEEWL